MKSRYLLSICLLVLLSGSTTSAATLKWRYRLPASFSGLPQILADSSGNGVAFVYSTTDPDTGQPGYTVVWLDSQGRELYKKTLGIGGGGLAVIGVTRNALTYDGGLGSAFVVVDRQGHESILPQTLRSNSTFNITYINDSGVHALETGTPDDPI